jgi:HEAT repeat protein
VSSTTLLLVVAAVQGVFFALLVLLVLGNRARLRARRRRDAATPSLDEPLARWLVGRGTTAEVVEAIRRAPRERVMEQLARISSTRVGGPQLAELTAALRADGWLARAAESARSRRWWRRLEAARVLAVLGERQDAIVVERLLRDRHPAVQAAATAALPRVGVTRLVALVIDALPERPLAVRLAQHAVLRETWEATSRALLERLRPDAAVARLEAWIDLADAVESPECLAAVMTLADHPAPTVRIAVARALKKYFHPDVIPALRARLADPDWRVRGQAARGLGALGASDAVPELSAALADPAWWVRFRAGLALAQLGEPGRRSLRASRDSTDRYARDMAVMVSGLTAGGVVELSEG